MECPEFLGLWCDTAVEEGLSLIVHNGQETGIVRFKNTYFFKQIEIF